MSDELIDLALDYVAYVNTIIISNAFIRIRL